MDYMTWNQMKKKVVALVIIIAILSAICCIAGLFMVGGEGERAFISVWGNRITLYGSGLYCNDSISMVAQGKASDFITLFIVLPVMLIALWQSLRETNRARLLLIGTIGYFLYTYTSYTFVWMYNSFFIIYVILMSLSFFTFLLLILSAHRTDIAAMFQPELKVKFIAYVLFFIAFAIGVLWLGKLAPSFFTQTPPEGLDHYTSLVIQALDLAILMPSMVISGILLLRKNAWGYLLSSVLIIKAFTLLLSILAMMLNMQQNGVGASSIEVIIFTLLAFIVFYCFLHLLRNCKPYQASI